MKNGSMTRSVLYLRLENTTMRRKVWIFSATFKWKDTIERRAAVGQGQGLTNYPVPLAQAQRFRAFFL